MRHLALHCILASMLTILCSCDGGQNRQMRALKAQLSSMSTRQKVGQLFVIHLEDLAASDEASPRTTLTPAMRAANDIYPCGGVILFAGNIVCPEQVKALNDSIHSLGSHPLIYIDEEGGRVARIGRNPAFDVPRFPAMGRLGCSAEAFDAGVQIGQYLKDFGFDVDLAPVADVNSNPANPVIGTRSFSSDPDTAAVRCVSFLLGLRQSGIEGCLKHFPGHGDTSTDSHLVQAESSKTWEEMLSCEMLPFKAGIASGARLIMTAHIGTPNVSSGAAQSGTSQSGTSGVDSGNSHLSGSSTTKNQTADSSELLVGGQTPQARTLPADGQVSQASTLPATMSELILQQKLRDELGYGGLIITDGMGMKAISGRWEPGEAAVAVIKAGADLILCPADYPAAFEAVLAAVESGEITMDRLDRSVLSILEFKSHIQAQ